jgi:Divergent InlB B-repeat domain
VKRIARSQSALSIGLLSLLLLLPLMWVNLKPSAKYVDATGSQNTAAIDARLPASSRLGNKLVARRPSATAYDEQLGMTFTQDSASLAYTVTAVAQQGTDNYGPAYLLNGLGNTGYWYQVGLSYNWDPAIAAGFQLAYSVFDPSGNLVLPTSNGAGLAAISPVNPGDSVLLSLSFAKGNVIMQGTDQNTGAQAQETFTAAGATAFSGSVSAPSNDQGFFSGLMTEWYHSSPYSGGEQGVTYTSQGASITSAWLWMDEFSVSSRGIGSTVFSNFTNTPVTFTNTSTMQTLSSNGATVAANATQFITGQLLSTVPLTFSYSVSGGMGNSTAPALTYTTGGAVKTIVLTQTGQTFAADSGSSWSITGQLPLSTATERWITDQAITGTASSSQTTNFIYSHQYYVTVNLDPVTGGSVTAVSGWFDAGTAFQSTASAKSGWQFEGWSGSGSGAYSGSSAGMQTTVDEPLTETATFYPGLTINASGNISVSYSNTAVSGSVPSGKSEAIYVPAGTEINLTARPILFIYAFRGWTGAAVSGNSKLSLTLNSPQTVTAASSFNYINIGIAVVVIIVIIAIVAVVAARKKNKPVVSAPEGEQGPQDQG